MGRRKFRLSSRKNLERKKPELVTCSISISIEHFLQLPARDSPTLLRRIQSLRSLLPCEWSLEGDSIGRGVFSLVKEFDYGTMLITVSHDCSWSVTLNTEKVLLNGSSLLLFNGALLDTISKVVKLLSQASCAVLCVGNPDDKFISVRDQRKGKFTDCTGEVIAFYDTRNLPLSTIRTSNCSIFVCENSLNLRCESCHHYRKTLFALVSKNSKSHQSDASAIFTNHRLLNSPQKVQRLRAYSKNIKGLKKQIRNMKLKLDHAMERDSICLDSETSDDLHKIMKESDSEVISKFSENSFEAIFWKHQKEYLSKKGSERKGNRWHPLMIRWCLYIRHFSSKAYDTLRNSGVITLPSQRTLRDYSNAVKADTGFSLEVDRQLLQAAKLKTTPHHKLVVLLLDEMHIREELVFNKHSGKLVGFSNLGCINSHLSRFEEALESEEESDLATPLAKSMMVFMVRGLFSNLKFPYAMFPCAKLVGEQLVPIFWECVFHLELIGFKVLATTCDGASVNRRFVALHDTSDKLVYKLHNVYAEEQRFIYCFSDPPHLIKTVRNCWASKTRTLWNNGKEIKWQHLLNLYEKDSGKGSGLSMVHKLKYEHLYLTSFSKMRVDLAAQVLSESVSNAIKLTGGPEATETSKFTRMFDKFFDCMNVTNFRSGKKSRKSFRVPYSNAQDERLKWLEKEFIPYLDAWQATVDNRTDCTKAQKKRMLLSDETLLGIRRTVKSFVEFIPYLFSLPEVKDSNLEFLSNHLCQDPLESFFGCQRQRGGTSDNPSVSEFFNNTQALRVIDSFCRGPVRGNCRGGTPGKKRAMNQNMEQAEQLDCSPLRKRRKYTTD